MAGRVAEVIAVTALATIVTVAIAAPVLRAPSERIFGMEIVGRHHDPFTVMRQFSGPIDIGVYSQPVTDVAGALLARISGAVAAYNWLVLVSFPLAAAAAFLLARHLALSPLAATLAAMAYAFAPFHLAHAAYHPHIAQTGWLPLYLLALWRCEDDASPAAVGFLGAAAIAVTLSNFYAGLIAAVITPVAVAAYWLVMRRADRHSTRRLGITVATLVVIAALGVVYALYVTRPVAMNPTAFAFPRDDLFRYSATWWGYLVPPVEHPLLGESARRAWTAAGVRDGLLEQQVSLGWGIIVLGLVAIFSYRVRTRPAPPLRSDLPHAPDLPARRDLPIRPDVPVRSDLPVRSSPPHPPHLTYPPLSSLACVPVLVIVAAAALVCSLSPEWTIGPFTFARPSALLYDLFPMFRSYARFGVLVQLMAALLAGVGLDRLRRGGTRRARIACVALVVLAAAEYAVLPSTLWRDVLPTTAHRWVMQQGSQMRVLDCAPLNQESASVQWLTGYRVTLPGGTINDCGDPGLSRQLTANGYTHLLVRRDSSDRHASANQPAPDGMRLAARFGDADVFEVAVQAAPIYTSAMTGFFPREHDAAWAWRWMGSDAAWTVVNASARPIVATLGLEIAAFHRPRRLELRLDGRHVQTIVVEPSRRTYQLGPLPVSPGEHRLAFRPAESPAAARDAIDNGDPRPLSFALGTWSWTVQGEQP